MFFINAKSLKILFLLAILLSSCAAPTLPPAPTGTPLPTLTVTVAPTATVIPTATNTSLPWSAIRRVIILSIDGMRPDAIDLAPMPNLQALMANGAYSMQAQTISPSATLPSHTSMLTGLCPDKHGVNWNDYIPANGYAAGIDIFDLAHAAGIQTVMYVGKEKLSQITEPVSLDIFEYINDRDKVIMSQLIQNFPENFGLLFIHFPTSDWMGHEYGWLSLEQLSVLRRADEAIGDLLSELDRRGLRGETLLIVTADHGGHDQTHGSKLPEDMTIPWVVNGPGVQPNIITAPIQTMDTAATAAWVLGLPIPSEWDGVPIVEAFRLPAVERTAVGCP